MMAEQVFCGIEEGVGVKEVGGADLNGARLACKGIVAMELWSREVAKMKFSDFQRWGAEGLLEAQASKMKTLLEEATREMGVLGKESEDARIMYKMWLVEEPDSQNELKEEMTLEQVRELYQRKVGDRVGRELEAMVLAVGGNKMDLELAGKQADLFVRRGMENLQMLGEIVSGLRHEIGNPMASVLGYVQMGLLPLTDEEKVGFEGNLQRIPQYLTNVANAAGMLDQILEGSVRDVKESADMVVQVVSSELRDAKVVGGGVSILEKPGRKVGVGYSKVLAAMLAGTIAQNIGRYVVPSLGGQKPEVKVGGGVIETGEGQFVEVVIEDNGPGYDESRIKDGFVVGGTGGKGEGTGMAFHRKLTQSLGGDLYPAKRLDGQRGARTVLRLKVV